MEENRNKNAMLTFQNLDIYHKILAIRFQTVVLEGILVGLLSIWDVKKRERWLHIPSFQLLLTKCTVKFESNRECARGVLSCVQ